MVAVETTREAKATAEAFPNQTTPRIQSTTYITSLKPEAKERSCCYFLFAALPRRQLTSTQCATSCDVMRYHLTSSRNVRRQRDDGS